MNKNQEKDLNTKGESVTMHGMKSDEHFSLEVF